MPQEFFGSFQENAELSSEQENAPFDYAHPDYYRSLQAVAQPPVQTRQPSEAAPLSPDYRDYTDPSHYGVFPSGGSQTQEAYIPMPVEWHEGDEEKNGPPQWQEEKVKRGRIRGGLAGLGGLAVTVGSWLMKLKGLAFLLKFGTFGLSALLTIAIYSIGFGWPFAIGFVGLLFIHEMGHVIAVWAKGLPVRGMIFIPFFGAAVAWSNSRSVKDEAEVAIAGPLAGAIGASVCLGLVILFHIQQTLLLPLAYMGFFLNLFNLAPVWPLDGGRIFEAINRRVSIVGFVLLAGLQIWSWLQGNPSIWLLFLLLLAGSRLLTRKPITEDKAYYKIAPRTRIALTVLYFGLVVALFLGMSVAHSMMGVSF